MRGLDISWAVIISCRDLPVGTMFVRPLVYLVRILNGGIRESLVLEKL